MKKGDLGVEACHRKLGRCEDLLFEFTRPGGVHVVVFEDPLGEDAEKLHWQIEREAPLLRSDPDLDPTRW